MTIRDYLRVVGQRWLTIAVVVLLGVAVALATYLVRPLAYTARTSLYVSAQVGDSPQQAYQGAQLSEQRVKSYVELVTSERVAAETVSRLGLNDSPDGLVSRLNATSATDSVIINISATDAMPQRSADIANTVGFVVTQVVEELERPTAPNGVAPVAVRVVQPAVVPESSSSMGLSAILALGLLAGLAVGVAVAFLRDSLDTTVKSAGVLSKLLDAPSLGVIAYDADVAKRPLTIQSENHSARAEAYRQIRTNLQFIDVDRPRKVIVVTSPMPSEGKTTTVANVAIALAAAGKRILVIEADLRRPKLSGLLGLDRSVGLTSVLSGRARLGDSIQQWQGGAFDVLSSGPTPPNPSELLSSNQMRSILDEVRKEYDTVLVDTPPLIPVTDAAAIAPATDGVVVVCRFEKTTRPQVEAAGQALRAVSVEPLGTVLSMVPAKNARAYGAYSVSYSSEPEVAVQQMEVNSGLSSSTQQTQVFRVAPGVQSNFGPDDAGPQSNRHSRRG